MLLAAILLKCDEREMTCRVMKEGDALENENAFGLANLVIGNLCRAQWHIKEIS